MRIFRRFRGDELQRQIKRLSVKSKAHEVRAAMSALEEIGERAVPPLIQLLLDKGEAEIVRRRAADTLAMLKDGRAVEPLVATLRDPSAEVRWNAVKALEALGDRMAIPELRRVAASDDGEFTVTWTRQGDISRRIVRDAARKAIEKIEAGAKGGRK